jgi:hypothetical protein
MLPITASQPSTSPATARPSPSSACGWRRISARAMWPVTMAMRLPRNGKTVQPTMPMIKLTTASELVCR